MAKTRKQKEEHVSRYADQLTKAKSAVFADYKGLNMQQLIQVRKQLLDQSAQFSVVKNTLFKRAFKETGLRADKEIIEGPTAVMFAFGDEISPIKILAKALKEFGVFEIRGGILNGEFIDANKVKTLAILPSKDELRGKVVGFLGSPLYGIVRVLQANLRNLVYVLSQISDKRQGSASTS